MEIFLVYSNKVSTNLRLKSGENNETNNRPPKKWRLKNPSETVTKRTQKQSVGIAC